MGLSYVIYLVYELDNGQLMHQHILGKAFLYDSTTPRGELSALTICVEYQKQILEELKEKVADDFVYSDSQVAIWWCMAENTEKIGTRCTIKSTRHLKQNRHQQKIKVCVN